MSRGRRNRVLEGELARVAPPDAGSIESRNQCGTNPEGDHQDNPAGKGVRFDTESCGQTKPTRLSNTVAWTVASLCALALFGFADYPVSANSARWGSFHTAVKECTADCCRGWRNCVEKSPAWNPLKSRSYAFTAAYRNRASGFLDACIMVKIAVFTVYRIFSTLRWMAGAKLPRGSLPTVIPCAEIRERMERAFRIELLRRVETPCNYAFPDTCPRPLPVLGRP